jgi:paraquat-inducible protein A
MNGTRAAAIGKAVCPTCGLLGSPAADRACRRCGTALHFRKPNSLQRTWALLIAAYVLYLPANLLPIMETQSLFGVQQDTIMSGVVYLWSSGSWVLALVVFIASVAVPLVKLLSLTVLLLGVQRRSHRQPLPRTKLYRFLELVDARRLCRDHPRRPGAGRLPGLDQARRWRRRLRGRRRPEHAGDHGLRTAPDLGRGR